MSTKYTDDCLRCKNNRSIFRSTWHLEQLGGRRTIKWDVNIVNDAENKKCEFSSRLYYFQSCRWSPFRWLFPGVMGPRCVSLSREGNFITYNFFISLREKIFSKLLLRTWWLMPNMFQICEIHHFDSGDVPLNSFFFTTNSVCSYHDWSIFMEWA